MSKTILALLGVSLLLTSSVWGTGDPDPLAKWHYSSLSVEESDIDSILALMSDSSEDVRSRATGVMYVAFVKRLRGAQKSIPRLIEMFVSDPSSRVRAACTSGLAVSGDPRVADLLLNVLLDPTEDALLRVGCMDGLAKMNAYPEERMAVGLANLDSESWLFRWRSINTVAGSDKKTDVEQLIRAFIDHHENPDERFLSIRMGIHGTAHDLLAEEYSQILHGVVTIDRELLIPLLDHQNREIRGSVAIALGDDSRAFPHLIEILKSSSNQDRRNWAAFRLGNQGDPRAIPALKGALHDDSVAELVYRSLLKLGVKVEKIEGAPGERPIYRIIEEH